MKKISFLLAVALMMQSCFSMRPIAVESELRRDHVGRSSTGDLGAALGQPNDKIFENSSEVWLYYANGLDVKGKRGQRTTRFSFDDKGIVRNVISDATVQRKRFDGGATFLCVVVVVGAVIAVPIIIMKNAVENY